jgi:hypothetical protein
LESRLEDDISSPFGNKDWISRPSKDHMDGEDGGRGRDHETHEKARKKEEEKMAYG